MITGVNYWVWYDDDPKNTLTLKIEQAVSRYQAKYSELPKECNFNQNLISNSDDSVDALSLEQVQFPEIELSITDNIPLNNFWLGPIPPLLLARKG